MGQALFDFFQIFTDVPFNFWFYLLLIIAPLLVFSVKPESKLWWRFSRLILAIVCTYILINLTLHTSRALDREDYEACLAPLLKESNRVIPSPEINSQCQHHIKTGDGASNVFYLVLGWVPSVGYVGFYELIWIIRHRKTIKKLGPKYTGKWFSFSLLIMALPGFVYIAIIAFILLAAIFKLKIEPFVTSLF